MTAIAAPAALRVIWEGEGGHAGAVLMDGRKDALCTAAEAVLEVEAQRGLPAAPTRWPRPVLCECIPAPSTAFPDHVTLEIDVRDVDLEPRTGRLRRSAGRSARSRARRGVTAIVECLSSDPPARSAAVVVEAIRSACEEAGVSSLPVVSRAYQTRCSWRGWCRRG